MRRSFMLFYASIAVLLGVPAFATEPEIVKLTWFAGCWASENGEPGSGEHWTTLAGGTMLFQFA